MSALASEIGAAQERRARRAAVARRTIDRAPDAAADLAWEQLDVAPAWLGLPDEALARFARQVGAVFCAPAVRLWIDGRRIAAARAALGEPFLRALLVDGEAPASEPGAPKRPRIDSPEHVGALLQAAGAGVLCASLPPGPLRRAARDVLGLAVDLAMPPSLAATLIERTQDIAARCPEPSESVAETLA